MAGTSTSTVTALVMLALGVASAEPPAAATASTISSAVHDQTVARSEQHFQPQPEPNYHYRYAVASRKTGDVKGAWEKRAGEDVWGAYFLRDPDGRWRTVHYEADGTGFYATVQRRPLYPRGKQQHEHGELHSGANSLPLEDATWKSALAAARQSAREDNHPALQKARLVGGVEGAASAPSYSTTRAPGFGYSAPAATANSHSTTRAPGFGYSAPAATANLHSTTRAPGFGFSSPAASVNSYSTTRAPAGFSSPAASMMAYSTTRAPGFGFSSPAASSNSYSTTRAPRFSYSSSQDYVKQSLRPVREQNTFNGPMFTPSYRSQPLRTDGPLPSYSSAYASDHFREQQQEEQQQEEQQQDADETTTTARPNESYSNQEDPDEAQPTAQPSEDAEAEQFAEPLSSAVSAPYRTASAEEENQYSNEAIHDEERDEDYEDKQRDEDGSADDVDHNPDDDHEAVPKQALQGSQLRNDHEALQEAPELRLPQGPQLHVHQLEESQQLLLPQVQEPRQSSPTMEHLLGPAWAEVAGHSSLFESQDFPLFRHQEAASQGTQEVPAWAQRERVDRTKGRRAAGHGQGLGQGAGRAKSPDRGAGRFSGPSRGAPSGDRPSAVAAEAIDKGAWSSSAPSADTTWSFGSKVRGKEDAAYPQPAAAAPSSKRGRNQNRGPVLFGQQVEASTPAGDRRLPPRGFALQQDDRAAWLQARQQHPKPASSSYSGWVPVTASLQVADAYRVPSSPAAGRPGPPRGRRRAPSRPVGGGDSRRASASASSFWSTFF